MGDGRPPKGGGEWGLETWASVRALHFVLTMDVGAEGAGKQNFGPEKFLRQKLFPRMCV